MTTISSIDARYAQDQIGIASQTLKASVSNLATGSRADANVADLSVGTVLAARVGTLRVTVGNAGQAKSLLETAKGALNTILNLLQKQKNLAVKAADDSLSDNERGFLNQEFQAIVSEVDRIATNANFNGKALLDGSISGVASLSSASGETVENYTLIQAADYELSDGGSIGTGLLNTTKGTAFNIIDTTNVGTTRAETTLQFVGTAGLGANASLSVGGQAITFSWADAGSAAQNAEAAADAFVAAARASTNATIRSITYDHIGGGAIVVRGAETGTGANAISFNLTNDGGDGAATGLLLDATTLGGDNIQSADGGGGAAETFSSIATAANVVLGADRTAASATYDENLEGALTNFTATFVPSGPAGTSTNSVIFNVEINGNVYTSQPVYLTGTSGYNNNGNIIKSGQVITFYDLTGPVDSSGELTDNAFSLTVSGTDYTIAGTTILTVQDDLNTLAENLETQLGEVVITQDRNISTPVTSTTDPDITTAAGTFLDGIEGYQISGNTKGDIIIRSDAFSSDGSHGSLGNFTFNRSTGILTTTVDGVEYSADLTSTADTTVTTGRGYYDTGTAYATATGTFVTDGTIVLATADTTDGREIRIDLDTNVNGGNDLTVIVNSDDDEATFESAFNQVFGVSDNESLSFQVGAASTDTIGVSIGSAKTVSLYKDDDGVAQTLDIATSESAIAAGDVLDNAIRNVISIISDVSARITAFDSSIQNNQASIQNADAARSKLLDTDYTAESTRFAESRVRVDAATAVLAQVNTRIQNLLRLLQQ
jgi:flagellin